MPDTSWDEIRFAEAGATRFVSGTFYQGILYAGTHSPGSVYSFSLNPLGGGRRYIPLPNSGPPSEAVLDMAVFKEGLYAAVEKNPGELRRWNPAAERWELLASIAGNTFFFMATFQEQLYLTGASGGGVAVFRTTDGEDLEKTAQTEDWAWIPITFQDRLFLLGHRGAAYSNGGALAYASRDGRTFEAVPELAGEFEYQSAVNWKGHLYLGTGGWTTNRKAADQARIYRYDGRRRVEVLRGIGLNGITDFGACGPYLFALADSGWESLQGSSALYRSVDGLEWERVRTFPHPEMRRIVITDEKIVLLGGKKRSYGVAFLNQSVCRVAPPSWPLQLNPNDPFPLEFLSKGNDNR